MALSYTVKISAAELQSKLSAMMPVEKKKYLVTVTLSNPTVDLSNGNNKIAVSSHVQVAAPGGVSASGVVQLTGSLSYDPDRGAFFFNNVDITHLKIEKVPDNIIPVIKKIILFVADKILAKHPIYKLNPNKLKHKFTKLLLKSVSVDKKTLLLKLSAF